jgi:hypothetical protein
MQFVRPAFAAHPKVFGRGPERVLGKPARLPCFSDDLKLFATTFIAGFLFVSILIG